VASAKIKYNDLPRPNVNTKSLSFLGKVLSFIGRPFYFLLLYMVLSVLLILNITGRTTRVSFLILFRNFPRFLFKLSSLLFLVIRNLANFLNLKVKKTKLIYPIKMKVFLSYSRKYVRTLKRSVSAAKKSSLYNSLKTVKFRKRISHLILTLSQNLPKKWLNILALKLRLKTLQLPSLKISRIKLLLTIVGALIAAISLSSFLFWKNIVKGLPKPDDLLTRKQNVSTKIYDRNGVLLYNIYKDENRTPVPLNRIPAQVRLATIAIEDAEFYEHPGISFRGIARAALKLIKDNEVTGGSTITQQLIKNALLTSEKTLVRKIREIVLAIRVEQVFSKNEILEMYLNEVSYGGTAYGIQEAAQIYFDKDVDQLTLGEAALLAGLPKSPTTFSPFGHNPEAVFNRQKEVLKLMRLNGFITEEQKKAGENENISFAETRADIKAPHFVMYVRQVLADKYGEELVSQGGLTVITTLDLSIQKLAEEVVKSEVEKLEKLNVGNGAAIVLDTQTGEILAMVGSYDYFDIEADGNVNLTLAERQPGSSIKVVNYSYALSHEYTPASILEDKSKTFNINGLPPYTPRNYDGQYRGKISLRSALAESRNIPAVSVLNSYGVGNMIDQGRKMGITTWKEPSNYGLSLTLGGGEVRLIDLAQVYATIANYGEKHNIDSIKKVSNYEGYVFEDESCENPDCQRQQVLDPRVAYMLIDILKDNNARSPAFGSNSLLVVPGHPEVVVKTGTSNDLRDNLTIGFNQKYLVASWVGNNDNSPMKRVASGITGATPIWNRIISTLIASEETESWQVPSGLISLPICTITNSLACEGCFTRTEWFLEENKPIYACNPEYIKNLNEQKEKELEPQDSIETAIAR
jgi:1A family penicillin-binding protein